MIKVGCCGFPVGREAYFRHFRLVEINSSFYNLPRLETVRRWKEEAPADFDFSLKAWQMITHSSSSPTYGKLRARLAPKSLARCGFFQGTQEVQDAWAKMAELASVLKPIFILFQTPAAFYPNANHLRDMYRFFKSIRRQETLLAWEPRGEAWEDKLVRRVCEDLGLIHVVDPLARESQRAPVQYWRLHGRLERGRIHYDYAFSRAELESLAARSSRIPAYAFFNNSAMWRDAQAFLDMIQPHPGALGRRSLRF